MRASPFHAAAEHPASAGPAASDRKDATKSATTAAPTVARDRSIFETPPFEPREGIWASEFLEARPRVNVSMTRPGAGPAPSGAGSAARISAAERQEPDGALRPATTSGLHIR